MTNVFKGKKQSKVGGNYNILFHDSIGFLLKKTIIIFEKCFKSALLHKISIFWKKRLNEAESGVNIKQHGIF